MFDMRETNNKRACQVPIDDTQRVSSVLLRHTTDGVDLSTRPSFELLIPTPVKATLCGQIENSRIFSSSIAYVNSDNIDSFMTSIQARTSSDDPHFELINILRSSIDDTVTQTRGKHNGSVVYDDDSLETRILGSPSISLLVPSSPENDSDNAPTPPFRAQNPMIRNTEFNLQENQKSRNEIYNNRFDSKYYDYFGEDYYLLGDDKIGAELGLFCLSPSPMQCRGSDYTRVAVSSQNTRQSPIVVRPGNRFDDIDNVPLDQSMGVVEEDDSKKRNRALSFPFQKE